MQREGFGSPFEGSWIRVGSGSGSWIFAGNDDVPQFKWKFDEFNERHVAQAICCFGVVANHRIPSAGLEMIADEVAENQAFEVAFGILALTAIRANFIGTAWEMEQCCSSHCIPDGCRCHCQHRPPREPSPDSSQLSL